MLRVNVPDIDGDNIEQGLRIAEGFGELVASVVGTYRGRRARRQLEQISEKTGLDEAQIAGRMAEDEEISGFIEQAIEAGAQTTSDEKRRLLAGVVADALAGGAAPTDHNRQLLRTVAELEPLDVHYLARFRDTVAQGGRDNLRAEDVEGWRSDSLLTAPTAAALVRAGLLVPVSSLDYPTMQITAYGLVFLDWLARDPDASPYFEPPA